DEGMAHLGCIGGDDDPLNQQVRVQLHQHTILEGAWLTLVAVDDEVAWPGAGRREEAPLHAGGEAGATTAAQTRMLDLLHQLLRREVFERLSKRHIAAAPAVGLDLVNARYLYILGDNARVGAEGQRPLLRHDRLGSLSHITAPSCASHC